MRVLGHYLHFPMLLLIAAEFFVSAISFWLCFAVLVVGDSGEARFSAALVLAALGFSTAVTIGITAVGLYHSKQRLTFKSVVLRFAVGLSMAGVLVAVIDAIAPLGLGAPFWLSCLAVSLILLITTRLLLWRWVDHVAFRRRVLVYGAGVRAASLLQLRRRSDRRGFSIVGFVPAEGDDRVIDDARVTVLQGGLLAHARANDVDEIVVAIDDRRRGFPVGQLLQCKFGGIAVIDLLEFLERETGKVKVDLVNPSWLIFSNGFATSARTQFSVRAMDIIVSVVMLILSAPVTLLAAAAILLDDGGPVIYRQRRIGFLGQAFTIYKFRSMVKDAEADGKAQWAGKSDGRITRVGAVLRKLRLDELPQLFNVLRGDMSLVGPRPERPEFVERLAATIPYYDERHVVKPGITGWAQLCYPYGSSDQDATEKLQYDLYYIKHKGLVFDLMVLLQTTEVVLWGKGAR